jgi:hypothetical protein
MSPLGFASRGMAIVRRCAPPGDVGRLSIAWQRPTRAEGPSPVKLLDGWRE